MPFLFNEIETIWIRFLVAEFRDQKSVKPIDEFDIIKSLRLSSIKYSACSSFAALSGNSDLKLHSTIRDKEVENELEEENEMEKGNAEVVKTSATKGPSEKVEETENNTLGRVSFSFSLLTVEMSIKHACNNLSCIRDVISVG